MDSGVDQETTGWRTFIKAINPERLYIDRADFDIEMFAQNAELDSSTPRVFILDPTAVVVRLLLKDCFRVEL